MDLDQNSKLFKSYDARFSYAGPNQSLDEEPLIKPQPIDHPSMENSEIKNKSRSTTPNSRYNWAHTSDASTVKKKFLANITNLPLSESHKKYINPENKYAISSKYMKTTVETENDESTEAENFKPHFTREVLDKSSNFNSTVRGAAQVDDLTPKKKSASFISLPKNTRDSVSTTKREKPNKSVERPMTRAQTAPKNLSRTSKLSPSKSRRLMFDIYGKEFEIPTSTTRHEVTQKTKNDIEERKRLAEYFKEQGAKRYENRVMRKEMENQMQQLQNRIKRLQLEQENMKRQLKRTETLTKKTIESKQRHLQDLVLAENLKLERLKQEQRTREIIYSEKREHIGNLKNSLALTRMKKAMAANEVRTSLHENLEKREQKLKLENQKKAALHKKTQEMEKKLRDDKLRQSIINKEKADKRFVQIVENERRKASEIQEKMKEMAKLEEALIDQIKTTQLIKESMEDRIRKIAATRVNLHKPLDFIAE
jgi:hypothetical protein